MWAVQYHRCGGPEVLRVEDVPAPRLREGQVLVRTLASAVSRIDVMYRRGRLPHGLFPKQTGFDAVGQVVDSRTEAIVPGTWVAVVLGLEPLRSRGTTVELLAVEPSRCGLFPHGYTPRVEDCALVLGGLTALRALRDGVRIRPGERMLVVGAGGPVGLAAIQADLRGRSRRRRRSCGSSQLSDSGRCRGLGPSRHRNVGAARLSALRRPGRSGRKAVGMVARRPTGRQSRHHRRGRLAGIHSDRAAYWGA